MKGAEILIQCLLEQGVDTVFGYPGGTILNIYDELFKNGKIKHYLTAHEQGAIHAADGYARATGKVGVCFATSGPGATNLVTGIATAYMDSSPVVAITCNVATGLLGRDSFQEVDIAGITMPITKHNYIVSNVEELADVVREAFVIAKSGRRGPVLIDIPKDITVADCEYKAEKPAEYIPSSVCSEKELKKAADLINKSEKPMILAGGGILSSGAEKELLELAEIIDCPVTTTLMGNGAYPQNLPRFTGMVGMHGTKASNLGITACDVLIAVGTRFSDRVISDASKFARNAKIIHIDIDPAEISKNIKAEIDLTGDAKIILEKLKAYIEKSDHTEWMEDILKYKKDFPLIDRDDNVLNPEYIMKTIEEKTAGDAVIVTEVGQNQMWASQFYTYTKPNTFISSGGLGTMGFGTGAAMGAQVGLPEKRVISIAGDGCFRMNCNELATVSYYNIPIIIVIMNNKTLGMVRQWQTLFYEKRYSETTLDRGPDFTKLAEAYYVDGYKVTDKESFEKAISAALSKNAPAVIDCQIDTDCGVFPMVSPNSPIDKIMTKMK